MVYAKNMLCKADIVDLDCSSMYGSFSFSPHYHTLNIIHDTLSYPPIKFRVHHLLDFFSGKESTSKFHNQRKLRR